MDTLKMTVALVVLLSAAMVSSKGSHSRRLRPGEITAPTAKQRVYRKERRMVTLERVTILLSFLYTLCFAAEQQVERRDLASLLASSPAVLIPGLVLLAPASTIVSIIVELNETVQAKVLGALSPAEILQVVHKLTAAQRSELISHIDIVVIKTVILPRFSQEQLGKLLEALPAETLVALTKRLTPQETLDIIKKLAAHDLIAVLKLLTDEQVTGILSVLPREGVVTLAAATHDDRLSRLVAALPAAS